MSFGINHVPQSTPKLAGEGGEGVKSGHDVVRSLLFFLATQEKFFLKILFLSKSFIKNFREHFFLLFSDEVYARFCRSSIKPIRK